MDTNEPVDKSRILPMLAQYDAQGRPRGFMPIIKFLDPGQPHHFYGTARRAAYFFHLEKSKEPWPAAVDYHIPDKEDSKDGSSVANLEHLLALVWQRQEERRERLNHELRPILANTPEEPCALVEFMFAEADARRCLYSEEYLAVLESVGRRIRQNP